MPQAPGMMQGQPGGMPGRPQQPMAPMQQMPQQPGMQMMGQQMDDGQKFAADAQRLLPSVQERNQYLKE